MTQHTLSGLEQRRRDLKYRDPELYDHIKHLEASKAISHVGNLVSGLSDTAGQKVANLLWSISGRHKAQFHARTEHLSDDAG